MYRYSVEKIIEEKNLTSLIEDFKLNYIPRFNRLESYYNVHNKILNRHMDSDKPNNKIAHGFAKYITNMATCYFIGKPIRYSVDDDKFKTDLNKVLEYNYTDNTNFEIAKEASKCGVSYELLYIDDRANLRTQKFKSQDIIPIYSSDVGEFLNAAIRIWNTKDIDDNETTEYAELYTDKEIYTYAKKLSQTRYELIDIKYHNFDDVPIIVYWNNEEQTGDYENIISLIDAYDKSQSDTANDFEYFTDAYLVLIGAGGGITGDDGEEDQKKASKDLKQNRILCLDEKGQAEWLIKNINDTAVENYKNRLYSNMFFLSQVPALSDESFAGNLTGIAIKYKLIGLEELAIEKENKFRAAQKKKLKLITSFINLKNNTSYDANEIEQKYERNFIDNLTDIIENVTKLEGVTSKHTQLSMLPMVKDIDDELETIQAEKKKDEDSGKIDEYEFEDAFNPR